MKTATTTKPNRRATANVCARLAVAVLLLAVAGCNDDEDESPGTETGGVTPPTDPATPPPPAANHAPTISGSPASSAKTSIPYSFQPSASDPDGDSLTFRIAGKPDWATFDATTGTLSGTPVDGVTGTYSNIQIAVSDGVIEAALPTFSITVSPPVIGSATLSWAPPDTNEDGSALTDLSGYVIRYGKTSGALDQTIELNSPGVTTVVVENLIEGTWYFSMASVNSTGVESRPTGSVSKTIS